MFPTVHRSFSCDERSRGETPRTGNLQAGDGVNVWNDIENTFHTI